MADENRNTSQDGVSDISFADRRVKDADSAPTRYTSDKKNTPESVRQSVRRNSFSGGSGYEKTVRETKSYAPVGKNTGADAYRFDAAGVGKTKTAYAPVRNAADTKKADSGVYIDATEDTAEEKAEHEKRRKNTMTAKDKKTITALAAVDFAVFAVIGIYLLLTGAGDPYAGIKSGNNFDPSKDYYDVSAVFAGELVPYMKDVSFPEGIQDSFKSIYSENQDTVGWIKIDDTSIDFPVVQSDDNEYYERKNFYGGYDRRGSIWLDYRCKVGNGRNSFSKNTILYGHNLTQDECVFRDVTKYTDLEYYKTHPIVEFNTIYNNFKWKVFACFKTTVSPEYDGGNVFYYIDPSIPDSMTEAFASECLTRSYFVNPAVDIQSTDKLLCLSTCVYDYNTSSTYVETRCVLMARLVRSGESEDVDVSGAYANENRRMPQIYYDRNGMQNPYANVAVFSR